MSLLCITPSRGRPDNVRHLLQSWSATRTGDSTRLLLAVDDDDSELDGYLSLALPSWAEMVVAPRQRMSPTLNHLALERAGEHSILGFMGDDHRPRTRGWDEAIGKVLAEMGSGLAYGNDLIQKQNLPTAVFITSDIVRALGYFAPPRQVHLYLDDFWLTLGEALQRLVYLEAVVVEHLHPVAGTAPMDAGYAEANATEVYQHDRVEFERWLEEDMEAAVERVNAAIRAPA